MLTPRVWALCLIISVHCHAAFMSKEINRRREKGEERNLFLFSPFSFLSLRHDRSVTVNHADTKGMGVVPNPQRSPSRCIHVERDQQEKGEERNLDTITA